MNAARRRALRAVLSALAGGGLTAASLGAAVPNAALAAGSADAVGAPSPTAGQSTISQETPAPEAPATTTPTTTPTTSTTTTAPATTPPPSTTTTPQASTPTAVPVEVPTVVLQRRQRPTRASKPTAGGTASKNATKETSKEAAKTATGPSNVALSPQEIAAQATALASTAASIQALGFYRIPLFLLPIYKAAAVQYGVPWQILAAINEIETDYGSDLSVSSAGAVGWMQFMPATWLQYGVDALNAGYADPYNPVDAIFAAARYLRAAGASTNLHAAILAYNHSEEYAQSVLLRARLISSYPRSVIATLTGLVDGRVPVTGKHVAWSPLISPGSSSSATGQANAVSPEAAASGTGAGVTAPGTPGSVAASTPAAAAAAVKGGSKAAPMQMAELTSAPNALVVAVQDGRIVKRAYSRALGKYLVLRDVYGDIFTYADLGSIAATYTLPKVPPARVDAPLVEAASRHDPAPSQPATAGVQSPVTLQVKAPAAKKPGGSSLASGQATTPVTSEAVPAGTSKVRLFAHPGNPDARAAAVVEAAMRAELARSATRLPLRRGAVVATGTVLGTVSATPGAPSGHIRFAIRPAGDSGTIAPGPVLANWAELQSALHPKGAKAQNALLGATAADVFLLSKAELQRTVLSDPGITIYACGRHDVAAGLVDKRVLAVLAFLSRSGLKPTVSGLHCGQSAVTSSGAPSPAYRGDEAEISAINGTPVAGHQGTGTITDLTVRTLLNLPAGFVPSTILSLMHYPGAASTHASPAYWNRIALEFPPAERNVAISPAAAASAAHSAGAGKVAAAPVVSTEDLSVQEWDQLISRVGALPTPTISSKPSSSAIPDTQATPDTKAH